MASGGAAGTVRRKLIKTGQRAEWDELKSNFNQMNFPPAIPPWERPSIGIPRRRPIRRTHQTAREQYVRTLVNDKAEDEADIYKDAAVDGRTAAIAWTSTDIPQINGSRHVSNTYGLVEEVELLGTLGAIRHIGEHSSTLSIKKFRIITDFHVALRELNRAFAPNSTATRILTSVRDLQQESFTIRIAWTRGHTMSAHGNLSSHAAARERLQAPPAVPNAPTPSLQSDWQLRLRYLKKLSRQRLQDATPDGVLDLLKPLSRWWKIFANKVYANAAYTPHVIYKWTAPAGSELHHCPHCGREGTPNLYHLTWLCPAFDRGREQLLAIGPVPTSESEHIRRVREDPSTLEMISECALEIGLFKMV